MAVQPLQTSTVSLTQASGEAGAPRSSASTQSISALGQALANLQALHRSDPARFKVAAAAIAQQLQVQARQLPPLRGQFFEKLSGAFHTAAESGDLGALQELSPPTVSPQGPLAARHYAATQASAGRPAPESIAGVIATAVDLAR